MPGRNGPRQVDAIAGVIGEPVLHSLSPALHAAAYDALGLHWSYLAFTVRRGDAGAAIDGARALGFRGLSVTMPHKQEAARHADQRSPAVERLASANTLSFRSGLAIAESTDGPGLLDDLADGGFDPAGARCVVIGAGGAACAAVLALATAGAAEVAVVNRTSARAAAAAALAGPVGRVAGEEMLGDYALVVQATPLGMAGAAPASEERSAELGARLGSGQLVVDMVYEPRETALLREAARRGADVRGGIGMLVRQAARQVALWTGEAPPVAAMRAAVGS